jgi:hypothetical protein
MQNRMGLLALVLGRMRSIQYWGVPVSGNVAGAAVDAKKDAKSAATYVMTSLT